jgi:ubiquitin carboxyl-terminal hydrolase 7
LSGRYKFDDERVTKEELRRALEEQYGGEEEVTELTKAAMKPVPCGFVLCYCCHEV